LPVAGSLLLTVTFHKPSRNVVEPSLTAWFGSLNAVLSAERASVGAGSDEFASALAGVFIYAGTGLDLLSSATGLASIILSAEGAGLIAVTS
jgi:hypothetical protein